jgi:hypothetical protein
MKSFARILTAGALCASALLGQSAHASNAPVTVNGGFVNDSSCTPTAVPGGGPDVFTFPCTGGDLYTGGFTGHTVSKVNVSADIEGNLWGTYDEWFVGTYIADGTTGGLHFRGTVAIDGATLGFYAAATIIDGTCGFAGSTGTETADGNAVFGGYTVKWTRPTPPVAPDPTCNPVDPDSLPV